MAKKKVSMFGTEVTENARKKAPTFRQWCKEQSNFTGPLECNVRIIWLPGRWDNYTLETEHFRLRVESTSPLYEGLRKELDEFTKAEHGLSVTVTDTNPGKFYLSPGSITGYWSFIDDIGLRFEPDALEASEDNPL